MLGNAQFGCQLTDFRIGVLHEVTLRLESLVGRVLYGLLQYLVIQVFAESQSVRRQVVVDVLRHVQVHGLAIL